MAGLLTEAEVSKGLATATSRYFAVNKELNEVFKGLSRFQKGLILSKFSFMRKSFEGDGSGKPRTLKQQQADMKYLSGFHRKLPGLFKEQEAAAVDFERFYRMQNEMEYIPTPPSIEKPTIPTITPSPEPPSGDEFDFQKDVDNTTDKDAHTAEQYRLLVSSGITENAASHFVYSLSQSQRQTFLTRLIAPDDPNAGAGFVSSYLQIASYNAVQTNIERQGLVPDMGSTDEPGPYMEPTPGDEISSQDEDDYYRYYYGGSGYEVGVGGGGPQSIVPFSIESVGGGSTAGPVGVKSESPWQTASAGPAFINARDPLPGATEVIKADPVGITRSMATKVSDYPTVTEAEPIVASEAEPIVASTVSQALLAGTTATAGFSIANVSLLDPTLGIGPNMSPFTHAARRFFRTTIHIQRTAQIVGSGGVGGANVGGHIFGGLGYYGRGAHIQAATGLPGIQEARSVKELYRILSSRPDAGLLGKPIQATYGMTGFSQVPHNSPWSNQAGRKGYYQSNINFPKSQVYTPAQVRRYVLFQRLLGRTPEQAIQRLVSGGATGGKTVGFSMAHQAGITHAASTREITMVNANVRAAMAELGGMGGTGGHQSPNPKGNLGSELAVTGKSPYRLGNIISRVKNAPVNPVTAIGNFTVFAAIEGLTQNMGIGQTEEYWLLTPAERAARNARYQRYGMAAAVGDAFGPAGQRRYNMMNFRAMRSRSFAAGEGFNPLAHYRTFRSMIDDTGGSRTGQTFSQATAQVEGSSTFGSLSPQEAYRQSQARRAERARIAALLAQDARNAAAGR